MDSNSQASALGNKQQEISHSPLEGDGKKEQAHTLNVYDMTSEELYEKIGYQVDQNFLSDHEGNFAGSDKVVVLPEGGVFEGQLTSVDGEDYFEVDSETDPNAITKQELKDILKAKESDLYKLYQKEISEK